MRLARRIALVIGPVVALAAGCGRKEETGGAPSHHPRDAELRGIIDRALARDDALVAAAEKAGRDCAAMARSFTEVVEEYRDVLGHDELESDPALRARFEELAGEHGERRGKWAERFARAIAPCTTNVAVNGALAPLERDPLRAD